tara:strand:- start:1675 stop:2298 length:624 start_codon:yes stop_codon:yes gene_type:complete
MDHLQKLLGTRHTFKTFLPKSLEEEKVEKILKSITEVPSCNNRYNYKVKVINHTLDERKAKIGLYDYVCTMSKNPVKYDDNSENLVTRSPRSYDEAMKWKSQDNLDQHINGQVLAPLVLVYYIADSDPVQLDILDIGLSCWNNIITAQVLGVQSGFCGCFDKNFMQDFLELDGTPVIAIGFGYANDVITNHDKHPDHPRPNYKDLLV